MIFALSLLFLSGASMALGAVFGMAHGIEVERKRRRCPGGDE